MALQYGVWRIRRGLTDDTAELDEPPEISARTEALNVPLIELILRGHTLQLVVIRKG